MGLEESQGVEDCDAGVESRIHGDTICAGDNICAVEKSRVAERCIEAAQSIFGYKLPLHRRNTEEEEEG